MNRLITTIAFINLTFSIFGQTDNSSVISGNYRKIYSNVLHEERILLISLPEDYDKSDKTYPVLFKLDGDEGNFLQAFSAASYLLDMTENAPDPIIIGIENTDSPFKCYAEVQGV
jgi:uncharacterized protein